MNFLTHYGRFNLFLVISGLLYFFILRSGYHHLAEGLLMAFGGLLLIDFVIFMLSSFFFRYWEKNPLILSLSGALLFYLLCLTLGLAALRYWLLHKNFTWPNFIFMVILWLLFYFTSLLIIHKTKKEY